MAYILENRPDSNYGEFAIIENQVSVCHHRQSDNRVDIIYFVYIASTDVYKVTRMVEIGSDAERVGKLVNN